ncbi:hypothetical protein V2G26_012848 [Clonostachys chloroleuca]
MHFFKTITLAFLSVSAASAFTAPEVRDMALQAESDYLQARDEYIEKRELFRRLGGNGTCKPNGTDHKGQRRYRCYKEGQTTKNPACGPCSKTATTGQYCLCNP